MKHSPRHGLPAKVSQSIQRQLNMYALAATATGIGVLAVAQPSEAKVVYTPAHQVIGANGVYNLDLNHDGNVDFLIQQWNYGNWASNNQLLTDAAVGNGVVGQRHFASALLAGASIGPNQKFIAGDSNGEVMLSVTHFTTGGTSYVHGSWANVQNRYLGLKFKISGETHYGWARLTVQRQAYHFTAALTGYAYETTSNTAIKAGQTSGNNADSSPIPDLLESDALSASASVDNFSQTGRYGSLGNLALGSQGVRDRRQP